MKYSWITCIVLLVLFNCLNAWAQTPKPLTELKPVPSDYSLQYQEEPFSFMGQIMHFGLRTREFVGTSASVYDLGGKYTRFEAWVGVPDSQSGHMDKWFSIRLDGKLVLTNESDPMKFEDPPIHISLDVTGAQSIRLMGAEGIYFGEPVLYRGTPAQASVANLIAPQDRVTVSASSVKLLWEPVSGATSYGVEIVCTKGSSPHIYALNANDSSATFGLSSISNGEYQWSVIAFNNKSVLGKFSKSRTFIVSH